MGEQRSRATGSSISLEHFFASGGEVRSARLTLRIPRRRESLQRLSLHSRPPLLESRMPRQQGMGLIRLQYITAGGLHWVSELLNLTIHC